MKLAQLLRHGKRIRTLGVDDGPFERGSRARVLVVGAVYAADQFEGLLSTKVRQDGHNATTRLIDMIAGSKFQRQLHLVLLDGITLGGFNVVDLPRLEEGVGIPCVAVTRKSPRREAIRAALANLSRPEVRERAMDRAGPVHRAGQLYFQVSGLEPALAAQALRRCTVSGHVPEALRAAHLIARGIVSGESGRRA